MDNVELLAMDDWVIKTRQPKGTGPYPIFLLLHGWTGDENSMWIFVTGLPSDAIFVAPRGIFPAPGGGYGWHPYQENRWPQAVDFHPAMNKIIDLLTQKNFPCGDFSNINLVGFSQGAALALTLLLTYPAQFQSAVGLSGFLPDGIMQLPQNPLVRGKHVFLAHGTQDEFVSIQRARQTVDHMERAGVNVTYCEDNVGHKLSASCFRGLEAFFSQNNLA